MKKYKIIYLVSPNFKEEEIKEIQEKLNSFIKEEGGAVENSETIGKKKLSYKIKKMGEAIFVNSEFYLEPGKIENLERKIKSEGKILRYLILAKKEEKKVEVKKPRKIKKEKVELAKLEEKLKEILNESQ